jgi:alpha-beta hydrolase superfamily lysophospholipase
MTQWQPDVLGAGFEQTTLALAPDSEGEVVATLVRAPAPAPETLWQRWGVRPPALARNTDVLYVHGWSDYFFQRHLADYWRAQGAQFYALDLRKYGRSIRPHQTPGYVEDLATYDEEIAAALAVIGTGSGRRLVLMGHSTGGLVVSLWAHRNPGVATALVLNSPWLEYQLTAAARTVAAPVLGLQAKLNPKSPMPNIDLGFYHRAVSVKREGEWEFNEQWRPAKAFAVRPAWLAAILAGHAQVAAGLDIAAPVLTLLSTRSLLTARWSDDMKRADVAIDVKIVAARAHQLGRLVTIARIPNAMHDVVLSEPAARRRAFAEMTRWLRAYL